MPRPPPQHDLQNAVESMARVVALYRRVTMVCMCLVCARQARERARGRCGACARGAIHRSTHLGQKWFTVWTPLTRSRGGPPRSARRAVLRSTVRYVGTGHGFAFSVSRHVTRETNTIDCNATRDVQRPETGQQQLNSLTLALATPAQSTSLHGICDMLPRVFRP
mgnify:CR=1 FL=1